MTSNDNDNLDWQRLKEKSLRTAGVAYLIGDAALATAKLMEGDHSGAGGALLWGIGGLTAAKYGNPRAEKQLALVQRRLDVFLKQQGIDLPAGLMQDRGLKEVESFLYAHPSELLNTVYAIGGAMTVKGGVNKGVRSDMASGALITAGALAGLLIPEKKPDPDHPAQGMGKAWEWAQEKPLRISGAFYHMNNIAMLVAAFGQQQKNKLTGGHSHWMRFLTTASYIFGNTMLALSSRKNTGDGNHETLEALAESSAGVIAAQPPEVREALVQRIAAFLSTQPEIGKPAAEIADLLQAKLHQQPSAQWQRLAEKSGPSLSPFLS